MTVKPELKEIHLKIVYAGPTKSGRATNLEKIHDHFHGNGYLSMKQRKTIDGETFQYNYTSMSVGTIRGIKPIFHIYSIPKKVNGEIIKDYFLSGADGIIFVADSQPYRLEDNVNAFREIEQMLHTDRLAGDIPIILQCNKQDASLALPTEILKRHLTSEDIPCFSAIASKGEGVFETLKAVIKMLGKRIMPSELGLEMVEN